MRTIFVCTQKAISTQTWINLDRAYSQANWSHRKWRIWSTKMADNQHFQHTNKLPYFKEIYGKSKRFKTTVQKLILTPAKDTGLGVPRWRRWASKFDYWDYWDARSRLIHICALVPTSFQKSNHQSASTKTRHKTSIIKTYPKDDF